MKEPSLVNEDARLLYTREDQNKSGKKTERGQPFFIKK